MREVLFSLFGLIALAGGIGVVFSRETVHSAFCLVMSFLGLATLYLLWGSPFISMLQVLIYTGAIVVLFVFVVLLLNVSRASTPFSFKGLFMAVILSMTWAFSLMLVRTLNRGHFFLNPVNESGFTLRQVSKLLFSEYLWPFEILSVFLLAIIVAVCLLVRPLEKES